MAARDILLLLAGDALHDCMVAWEAAGWSARRRR